MLKIHNMMKLKIHAKDIHVVLNVFVPVIYYALQCSSITTWVFIVLVLLGVVAGLVTMNILQKQENAVPVTVKSQGLSWEPATGQTC